MLALMGTSRCPFDVAIKPPCSLFSCSPSLTRLFVLGWNKVGNSWYINEKGVYTLYLDNGILNHQKINILTLNDSLYEAGLCNVYITRPQQTSLINFIGRVKFHNTPVEHFWKLGHLGKGPLLILIFISKLKWIANCMQRLADVCL